MDDLKRVAQQFADAANIAPIATSVPEFANYFKAAFMDPVVKQGLGAGGSIAGQKAKEADEADEMARRAKAQEISNKLDPSKFTKVRKADGGFDFFDPEGKPISINDYAQVTGQRRVDVLKDSENPIDQEYINDWNNANELAQAFYNGDELTKQAYMQANPDLKNVSPQDFMSELIKKYPHLYGRGNYDETLGNRSRALFRPGGVGGGSLTPSGGGGGGWRPS